MPTAQGRQPANTAVIPSQQKGWAARHEEKVKAARAEKHDLLLIGDSITHNLDLPPYKAVWDQFFAPRRALNLGYSGARTENILWNLQNGELDNQSPKVAVLLIGTNNSDDANYPIVHTPEQIAEGTQAIVALLREKLPETKILLLRIFPRTNVYRKGNEELGSARRRFQTNLRAAELVARLADGKMVHCLDVNHVFLRLDGSLDPERMPDLLHPSPQGALAWARAMEPTLCQLMGDSNRDTAAVDNTALAPVPKLENDCYDWYARHAEVLKVKNQLAPEVVLIGDSITHFWAGPPRAPIQNGPQAWQTLFGERRVLNLGFGWDRTQNVLWRLDHGEFDGLHPRWVIINIGTNNFSTTANARANTPAQVAEGIRAICLRVRSKSPESRLIVMGVLPRGAKASDPFRSKIGELNKLASELGQVPGITFLDIGEKFLQPDGELPRSLMNDFCHPTEAGYAIWAAALAPLLAGDR
ncbi:MAG: acetylhydrolase [Candidatus Anammoximicrobium sp.]|nr:acetylhydrolase [Candidatus Anammoximicrobium sp.]